MGRSDGADPSVMSIRYRESGGGLALRGMVTPWDLARGSIGSNQTGRGRFAIWISDACWRGGQPGLVRDLREQDPDQDRRTRQGQKRRPDPLPPPGSWSCDDSTHSSTAASGWAVECFTLLVTSSRDEER